MRTEHWLYTIAVIALVGVVAFAKGKACVNDQNGDARYLASWLWPCAKGESAVTA